MNAPNQRFWMQYHLRCTSEPTSNPSGQCSYHLVRPTSKHQAIATTQDLVPYRQWVYLCHKGVFLHGPFDFQLTPGGRRSRDRIGKHDWTALRNAANLYKNDPLMLSLNHMLLVHCTFLRNQEVKSMDANRALFMAPLLWPKCYGAVPPHV